MAKKKTEVLSPEQLRKKEIEEKLARLRIKPTDRLFRASETISSGPRVRKDQIINMHKDTVHECLTMLSPAQELHVRETEKFTK